jgi:hypothetical protein
MSEESDKEAFRGRCNSRGAKTLRYGSFAGAIVVAVSLRGERCAHSNVNACHRWAYVDAFGGRSKVVGITG